VNIELTLLCGGVAASTCMLLYYDLKTQEHCESLLSRMIKKTEFFELNAGQNHKLKITNKSFDNVAKFKCMEMTLRNQTCMHEEIKSILYSESGCYRLVQNLLLSHWLSMNVNIRTYRTACCFISV
jgi:hypothetical protein